MSTSDSFDLIRRKTLLGSQLTAKDKEYSTYAGASAADASRMAMIDFILKENLASPELSKILRLYRSYLDQQRKAFFSTVDADILTKLAILVGYKQDVYSVVRRATRTKES